MKIGKGRWGDGTERCKGQLCIFRPTPYINIQKEDYRIHVWLSLKKPKSTQNSKEQN